MKIRGKHFTENIFPENCIFIDRKTVKNCKFITYEKDDDVSSVSRDNLRGQKSLGPLKMSLEMAHKVILPPKKNYIPQFLKQRDINSYSITCVLHAVCHLISVINKLKHLEGLGLI